MRALTLRAAIIVDGPYEAGFDGTLSVEHEDPLWGGADDKITEGLRIAHQKLRPLIAVEPSPTTRKRN
jgi:hypothetical protein